MDQHIGAVIFAVLFLGIMIGALLEAGIKRPTPPTTAQKPPTSLARAAAESAAAYDWLQGVHLTANQIDCMCDALVAIDDAREGAPPGSPVRAALDRLHTEADALVTASVR